MTKKASGVETGVRVNGPGPSHGQNQGTHNFLFLVLAYHHTILAPLLEEHDMLQRVYLVHGEQDRAIDEMKACLFLLVFS